MLHHGDCREVMAQLDAESIDAIVTDPPYGLEFMGKEWDRLYPDKGKWRDHEHQSGIEQRDDTPQHRAAVRQPAFLLRCETCGGNSSGAWNRCACVSPQFKRPPHISRGMQDWHESWARGAYRVLKPGGHLVAFGGTRTFHRLTCAVEDAGFEIRDCLSWLYGSGFPKSHNLPGGIGTALKPGWEPIILARKPLMGTVSRNVEHHGTGALNIDRCRIGTEEVAGGNGSLGRNGIYGSLERDPSTATVNTGRWPANVVLDEEAAELLDAGVPHTTSTGGKHSGQKGTRDLVGGYGFDRTEINRPNDSGGPSRFFYCAKASRSERGVGNTHPTVKPVALMRWLVRLITPPGGVVLDPFLGSGTTGIAAELEGHPFVGIEQNAAYLAIAQRRIAHVTQPLAGMAAD
jgi:DNA modification methylase